MGRRCLGLLAGEHDGVSSLIRSGDSNEAVVDGGAAGREWFRLAVPAMGTRFELLLGGRESVQLRAAAEAARAEIEHAESELSRYRRDGFLAFLHREAERRPVQLGQPLFELLDLCRRVHEQSEGAFDLTIAPRLAQAGIDRTSPAMHAGPRARVGMEHVQLDADARTVRLPPGGRVRLDFGAVGKGYALDQAREVLRDAGVEHALVHGGTSTCVCWGAPPHGSRWVVAVRDPREPRLRLARAELVSGAFSVSARRAPPSDSGREREIHVVDPRRMTDEDAPSRWLAAVIDDSAAVADAWSTALLAGGPYDVVAGPCLVLGAEGEVRFGSRGQESPIGRFVADEFPAPGTLPPAD